MSFQFNGTQANVTLTGSAALQIPSSAQTVINVTKVGTGAVQTHYTVTAGKTFYLMGISSGNSANDTAFLYKPDGTTALLRLQTPANNTVSVASYSPIWVFAAGEAVKTGGSNTGNINIWGFEQ